MRFFIYVFLIISFSTAYAEKTANQLISSCLGCHGIVGYNNIYPAYRVPKIANQHKDYIISALNAYRSGERPHYTMKANVAGLSDSDIEIIANYFSSLKDNNVVNQKQSIKVIDEANSCSGCHGLGGNSANREFPKIAGQYESYMYHALMSYKSGNRKNAIMNGIARGLNKNQMKKLSKYFSQQSGLKKINQKILSEKK